MTCQSAAPSNNTAAGPATLYAQAENGALFLSHRPGWKVSMDFWTYPKIIPRAVSCEGKGREVGGEDFYTRKRENSSDDEGEMRSKRARV